MTFNLSMLDGANGFVVNGISTSNRSGFSVSSAGDFNGDGIDDVIIGSYFPGSNLGGLAGESYLIFGSTSGFDTKIELSDLDGNNGLIIEGISEGDRSGISVDGIGDINGDGLDDIIIGAFGANSYAGESYVIFGNSSGLGQRLALSELDGTNGFQISGMNSDDFSGFSVSGAADFNGDGIMDIVVGASGIDIDGNPRTGGSYLIFGSNLPFNSNIDLLSLNGHNGFRLIGISANDFSGTSVSGAGDFNGDGLSDLIIGAYGADINGHNDAGEAYVVFGSGATFPHSIELSALDGIGGFRLNGDAAGDWSGRSVANAGDVNGDGIDDIIVGAFGADPNSRPDAGISYVIFGSRSEFNADFDLSSVNGTNGFRINGVDAGDRSGFSVAGIKDVNGDGIDDIAVGAFQAGSVAGKTYVIFGSSEGFSDSFDLSELDGVNGISIDGINAGDGSGISSAGAGDINGDGIGDFVVGGFYANPNELINAGQSYVIFGSPHIGGANQAPFAENVSVAANEDSASSGNLLLNDYDPDTADSLFVSAVNGKSASVGTSLLLTSGALIIVRADGSFDYDPNGAFERLAAGESDADAFGYEVFDGYGGTDTANVTITISGVNDVPTAANDVATVSEDGAVAGDVLANDADADGDALTLAAVNGSAGGVGAAVAGRFGTLVLRADGTFAYFADRADALIAGQSAADAFFYRIADGFGGTAEATLSFAISGVDEVLRGGPGRDALTGGAGPDRLSGGGGNDVLAGGRGDDALGGGAGADRLFGQAGDDALKGGTGNDLLDGRGGNDRLLGQGGNDVLKGGDGRDVLLGGNGDDLMSGQAGDDLLRGGAGDDTLNGKAGRDRLEGQGGDDLLRGGNGNDRLLGGGGADSIFGDRGDDALSGGRGADVFHFRSGDGADRVLDFAIGRDLIDIALGARGFDDLEITQQGRHAFVDYGADSDVIKLLNTDAEALGAADFAFG